MSRAGVLRGQESNLSPKVMSLMRCHFSTPRYKNKFFHSTRKFSKKQDAGVLRLRKTPALRLPTASSIKATNLVRRIFHQILANVLIIFQLSLLCFLSFLYDKIVYQMKFIFLLKNGQKFGKYTV